MLTEARQERLMADAFDLLERGGIATMEREEASIYLGSVMQLAFELLRTVEDDEFMRGWLDSARDSLSAPPAVQLRMPS
jgi:hypothetical protein